MTNLEMEFFEEFKAIDNICKDMFQSQQGVTEYINQMDENMMMGSRSVPNWNEKYKMLKHLRGLRNQIAHDSGAPELMESDLLELQNFHKQLLIQKDPLAIISKSLRETKTNSPEIRVNSNSFNVNEENEDVNPLTVIVIMFIAALLGFVFWKLLV